MPDTQRELGEEDWARLLYYGHTDRRRAYETYTSYHLSTSGQIYWSDSHQRSTYLDGYHREVDRLMGTRDAASEMITEIYVPRARLADFLDRTRDDFRRHRAALIYGTIRLIERDDEAISRGRASPGRASSSISTSCTPTTVAARPRPTSAG